MREKDNLGKPPRATSGEADQLVAISSRQEMPCRKKDCISSSVEGKWKTAPMADEQVIFPVDGEFTCLSQEFSAPYEKGLAKSFTTSSICTHIK